MMRTQALTATVLALMACGDGDPADVSGTYTVTITNGDNGCMTDGWTDGESTEGIRVTVTQTDGEVAAVVEGLVGTYLTAVLGSNRFQGRAVGNRLDLTLIGTNEAMIPSCRFTTDAFLNARVDGQFIEGTITYEPSTDGAAGCGLLDSCSNEQTLVGTRPLPE